MGTKPFTNIALESMRHAGYSFRDALCELIDNSLWHGNAKNIKIDCTMLAETSSNDRRHFDEIFVADDGDGMDYDTLATSPQIGKSTSYNSSSTFGRFGYGMIAGAISQCQTVEIYSKRKDGDWNYLYYNILEISQEGKDIELPTRNKTPPEKYLKNITDSGTIVIWSGFDIGETYDMDFQAWMQRGWKKGKMGILKKDLGRIYRKQVGETIVSSDNGKTVVIKNPDLRTIELCGHKVEAIDPLYLVKNSVTEDDPDPHHIYDELVYDIDVHPDDLERAEGDNDKLVIRMTILNETWRNHNDKGIPDREPDHWPRFIQENEPISFLRMGREIAFPEVHQIGPRVERVDRYWGMEIEFPSTLDRRFSIRNVKVGITMDKPLRDQLHKTINAAIMDARRVIGKHLKQSRVEAVKEVTAGPHSAAEERFKDKGLTETPKVEQAPEEKKAELTKLLYERFAKHDQSVDKEKFGEIGVVFQDDTQLNENLPFVEIRNNLGNNILIYNLHHPFFINLDTIYEKLEKMTSNEFIEELGIEMTPEMELVREEFVKTVGLTRYQIDLLLGAFAAAQSAIEHDRKQEAGSTIHSIINRWTENLYAVANDKDFDKRVG